MCWSDRGGPSYGDFKQIKLKASKVLKHEGLQFRIKKGSCLETTAENLLKEKKPRKILLKSWGNYEE